MHVDARIKVLPKPLGPYFTVLSQAAGQRTHSASASHGVPVYSPAYSDSKLNCLVTEANMCERPAQGHTRQCSSWLPV